MIVFPEPVTTVAFGFAALGVVLGAVVAVDAALAEVLDDLENAGLSEAVLDAGNLAV